MRSLTGRTLRKRRLSQWPRPGFSGRGSAHCEVGLASAFAAQFAGEFTEVLAGLVSGFDGFVRANANHGAFSVGFAGQQDHGGGRPFVDLGGEGTQVVGRKVGYDGLDKAEIACLFGLFDEFVGQSGLPFCSKDFSFLSSSLDLVCIWVMRSVSSWGLQAS